jgi:hypothetical protein
LSYRKLQIPDSRDRQEYGEKVGQGVEDAEYQQVRRLINAGRVFCHCPVLFDGAVSLVSNPIDRSPSLELDTDLHWKITVKQKASPCAAVNVMATRIQSLYVLDALNRIRFVKKSIDIFVAVHATANIIIRDILILRAVIMSARETSQMCRLPPNRRLFTRTIAV